MSVEKVLVIDDEQLVRDFITETLHRKGIEAIAAENGKTGLSLFKESSFDLVITDMKMPDLTGIDVLKKIKEISPQTVVVVITAFGSVENAVEAMRLGAFNYLIKPFSPDTIETVIEKANEHASLLEENRFLRNEMSGKGTNSQASVIGESAAMKKILQDVERIAKSNANVFINGESGTGKEVIAQQIHNLSLRSGHPFIKVNCAAIPETLIESEFFGHEKGAFTDAKAKRLGRFELANSGTLLLDEVTEIPMGLQAKLLRVIQEQIFERVGGTKPVKVDVRLVSTSNRIMKEAIDEKVLREDLYYRLNVVPIHIPPLRERKEDIIPLARYFLKKLCLENHKEAMKLTSDAEKKLLAYPWPGNVRELANIIERAVVMSSGQNLGMDVLYLGEIESGSQQRKEDVEGRTQAGCVLPVGISLKELERRFIIETLQANHQERQKTAEILGISPRTLRNKLQEYNCES
jgi:two-component system response regulator AtoC